MTIFLGTISGLYGLVHFHYLVSSRMIFEIAEQLSFFLIHDEISNIDERVNVVFLVNDEFRDDWIVVVFAMYADTKRTHIQRGCRFLYHDGISRKVIPIPILP